ncbi:MAG: hypothetical protein RLZZ15_714 [Verrucomicrobiota bacterium]
MDDPRLLGPIPTPPSQRWKEIRLLYLPRVVFILGVIAAVLIWSRWVAPATLVAEAEVTHAEIRAPQAGVLAGLTVDTLKPVRAGEIIGRVAPANPGLLDANLGVIRAELAMVAASMSGATDKLKISLDYENLRLNWMNQRVELASLQGRLQSTEADLVRGEQLFKQGLVTEASISQLRIARESLRHQIERQDALVAHLEPIVRTYSPKDETDAGLAGKAALDAALKVQEAKLRAVEQQLAPLPLIAPIDGVVTLLARRNGEGVAAGDAVARVLATKSDRVTGFLRQPMPFTPRAGQAVELRTRATRRVVAASKIIEVGPAMESVSPSILAAMHVPTNTPPPPGLRIQIAIPTGLKLVPGEFVDVTVKP